MNFISPKVLLTSGTIKFKFIFISPFHYNFDFFHSNLYKINFFI
ncbi:hypothetical protein CHCC15087_0224 [Bacillus licheniformis]|nr:hypothetical protein CHCC15087_0224 [Bacillus licheniformis]